jgi:hypothetical protein
MIVCLPSGSLLGPRGCAPKYSLRCFRSLFGTANGRGSSQHAVVEHRWRTGLQCVRIDALHHPRGLNGVAGRAHAEHVVGSRDAQLFEKDVRHQAVVVLSGVDDGMAPLWRAPPQLGDDRRHLHEVRPCADHIGDPHGAARVAAWTGAQRLSAVGRYPVLDTVYEPICCSDRVVVICLGCVEP